MIIKNSINERNTSLKNIYLILCLKGTHCFVVSLRDRWRDIYSKRGLLASYFLPGARGANACTPLQAVSSGTLTPLLGCVYHARFPILCPV